MYIHTVHTYIHVHTNIHTYIHIHTYVHTNIHTYTHIQHKYMYKCIVLRILIAEMEIVTYSSSLSFLASSSKLCPYLHVHICTCMSRNMYYKYICTYLMHVHTYVHCTSYTCTCTYIQCTCNIIYMYMYFNIRTCMSCTCM